MQNRIYDFSPGFETSVQPDAGTPVDPNDLITKSYLEGNAATSISKSGSPQLTGDVTLTGANAVTLNQVGNNIEISAPVVTPGINQLTGDVTAGPGSGSQSATIANDAVTNTKLANMVQSSIKGRAVGSGTGDPTDLTAAQATEILDNFVGDSGLGGTKGLVPAPAAGDSVANKFLKADGSWTTVIGGSGFNLMTLDTSANNWAATKSDNFNFDLTVGDWVAFANGTVTNSTLTGGSPGTTMTRVTSGKINGNASGQMDLGSGSSRQNEGVSCLVNIPPAYRGQVIELKFPYSITGSIVSGDVVLLAYDVTNSITITPTTFSGVLGSSGITKATFPIATNCAQIRVAMFINRTSTGALSVIFDDVSLSPFTVANGLAGSNPISYTPTFTGFGTVTTQAFRYSWIGNRVIIEGSFTSGTPTATIAEISLPTNLAIDSSLGTNVTVGTYAVNIAASGQFNVLASSNGTTLKIGYSATVGAGGNTPANGSAISSNGALITFFAVVLINNRSANLSIGESSTFSIAPYLANGTRVTTTPTRLGEYRSQLRNASASTFTDTNGSPATAPSASDGIRIYSGNAYSAADTNNNPTRYDIFVGKNKVVKPVFYSSVGRTGFIDTKPITTPDGVGGALTAGYLDNYDPVTGIYTIMPLYFSSAVTSHDAGFTGPTAVANDCYFDLIVSENALAVSSQQPRSEIYLEGSSGHGSTNTTIRRFTSSIKNTGSAITYSDTDSATLGSSFTINESGVYSISYVDARDVATSYFGLSLNSSQLTTSILSITAANRLIVNRSPADALQTVSICTVLNAGDIIRPHTDGTPGGVTNISFRITKVSS